MGVLPSHRTPQIQVGPDEQEAENSADRLPGRPITTRTDAPSIVWLAGSGESGDFLTGRGGRAKGGGSAPLPRAALQGALWEERQCGGAGGRQGALAVLPGVRGLGAAPPQLGKHSGAAGAEGGEASPPDE